MKKTLLSLCLVVTVAASCPRTAYQSISATETAVLNANAAYLDSVVSGVTPTNSVPTVEAAFNDTQLALHAAAVVASGGASAPVPAATAAKAQSFTNMVAQIIQKKPL